MPCMNATSAGVNRTFDRSRACSAWTTLLSWPGAPGCTIGGLLVDAAPQPATVTAAVSTDPTNTARNWIIEIRCTGRMACRPSYRTVREHGGTGGARAEEHVP